MRNDAGLYDPHAYDADHLDQELARLLTIEQPSQEPAATQPLIPVQRPSHRSNRRQLRANSHFLDGGQRITHVTILIAVITLCAVCMLGWSISYSYRQLCAIASSVLPPHLARCWPLTVYGPWFVAALSILRATVQRRSTRRSWCVLLCASAVAAGLCVSYSTGSLLAFVLVGIPPITALVCFWELVGQVSSRYRRSRHGAHAQGTTTRRPSTP
ncbi:DUF2637 domain-containing protein [Streptomyces sp. TRM68367]|uniref:DUF2637 domain-containing protein n=1 Tax=Streptomyces sp. TRM68367 TaxID=2758415 RepID=UPI00165BD67B|nr:DUF2637 domain-containing protein [Streptomyces sp. TRM68367]MBC9727699.1 DUF2637 domain-containing protein [Streptomyces sp. TRM68367]